MIHPVRMHTTIPAVARENDTEGQFEAGLAGLASATLSPLQDAPHRSVEDEVVLAENLCRAVLVEMGEEDFGLSRHDAVHQDPRRNCSAFRTHVQDLGLEDQLFPGQHLAVEHHLRHLRQNDLLLEVVGVADEDTAGLGKPFEDQRRRHHRITGEVVGEMILGQAQVFHGAGGNPVLQIQESVDPDPAHRIDPRSSSFTFRGLTG